MHAWIYFPSGETPFTEHDFLTYPARLSICLRKSIFCLYSFCDLVLESLDSVRRLDWTTMLDPIAMTLIELTTVLFLIAFIFIYFSTFSRHCICSWNPTCHRRLHFHSGRGYVSPCKELIRTDERRTRFSVKTYCKYYGFWRRVLFVFLSLLVYDHLAQVHTRDDPVCRLFLFLFLFVLADPCFIVFQQRLFVLRSNAEASSIICIPKT